MCVCAGGQEAVSSVLSKAGPKADKQLTALATHLKIPINFEEFSKVHTNTSYTHQCKGAT
jgi:hypothetical protein